MSIKTKKELTATSFIPRQYSWVYNCLRKNLRKKNCLRKNLRKKNYLRKNRYRNQKI